MRYLVILGAVAFKLWFWWRMLPAEAHHVICIVALQLAFAILLGLLLEAGNPSP